MKCAACGAQMKCGVLMSPIGKVGWTPFPEDTARIAVRIVKRRRLHAWACESCGLLTLALHPKCLKGPEQGEADQ